MDNENVAAPAPAGEAAPLNNNTTAPSPSIDENGANVSQPIFSEAEAKQIKDFFDNNGGFEKVKKNLTMRQADQPQPQQPTMPEPQMAASQNMVDTPYQPQPQQSAPARVQGGITPEEFMTQQYFQSLSQREEYAPIADQMRSGEVLKQMAKFNIQPMVNGQFNDQQVRDFLSLYAKTVPPAPAAAPVTPTPTVEYVQVAGDNISNMNEAMAVLSQDRQLRAMGQAGHPLAQAANEFFDKTLSAQQNRGKREHKTIDELRKK